jgi:co-chaperonin GroES (HSP10)
MSNIYPAGYRVLIRPDELEEVSEGGIIIKYADERIAKAATTTGVVVAIGREAFGQHNGNTPWVEKGDKVYYAKYSGKIVQDPSTKEEMLIVNDEDIIGIIQE